MERNQNANDRPLDVVVKDGSVTYCPDAVNANALAPTGGVVLVINPLVDNVELNTGVPVL